MKTETKGHKNTGDSHVVNIRTYFDTIPQRTSFAQTHKARKSTTTSSKTRTTRSPTAMNTTTTTHPTQQYASPNTLAPTGPTGPSQQQVKPSTSVTTLVPIDIEENCPNGTPRRRNSKPREFGLKALRNHLLAVVARTFLIAFSIAALAYVAWVHKHWTSEREEARDDENYEGGYVAVSFSSSLPSLSQFPSLFPTYLPKVPSQQCCKCGW